MQQNAQTLWTQPEATQTRVFETRRLAGHSVKAARHCEHNKRMALYRPAL